VKQCQRFDPWRRPSAPWPGGRESWRASRSPGGRTRQRGISRVPGGREFASDTPIHERYRPPRGPLLPLPARRSPPRRVRLPGRLPRGPGRVRPAEALPRPRSREPLRVSPRGVEALPRGGSSPARRRLARPAVPRGDATDSGREAVLHHGGGAGLGGDGGKPRRGAPAVLRPVQAGGPGTGGGAEAQDAGTGEDSGDPGGAGGSGSSPRRTRHAPKGGGTSRPRPASGRANARRADDGHVEPHARLRFPGVPGSAQEGEGRGVTPESLRERRGDPHRGAGVAPRPAGEAEGLRAGQGEAGGREARPGEVPVAPRRRRGLRRNGAAGGGSRRPTGQGRTLDGRELQDPLPGP